MTSVECPGCHKTKALTPYRIPVGKVCGVCWNRWKTSVDPSHLEKVRNYTKRSYQKHRAKRLEKHKIWAAENRPHLAAYAREYRMDLNVRLAALIRNRVGSAVRGTCRPESALTALGCTVDELVAHLESQFQPGMTWDNWTVDGWHIDHIKPLAKFDLTDRQQFLQACHYTNLQPLWASDNLAKGARGALGE